MACCRSSRISLTSNLALLTQRFRPSLCHVFDHDRESDHEHPQPPLSPIPQRQFHNASTGFGALIRDRRVFSPSLPFGLEPLLCRYSSSAGESSEFEFIKEAAAGAVAQSAPAAGEVAAAAADSALPVAALQYLIDGIHSFAGLNWWAAIAVTTVLIRTVTIPLLIQQMKATTKLNLMRPQMDEIKQQMQNSMDPQMLKESQKQMQELFKQYGVSPFTPLKGLLIQGPIFISFFLAISNMVEKVPSFKAGGALWFTDLTTPDPLYMLPVLTSLTFLATVELNMQDGMEGNPMADTMKNFSRVLALLTIPFTASFPKAIFCYWITSNLFSLLYGFVLKCPPVRELLDLPEMNMQAPTVPQPSFPLFGEAEKIAPEAPPTPLASSEKSLHPDRRVSSSSSVISQRIRNLERSVKARKKPKKK